MAKKKEKDLVAQTRVLAKLIPGGQLALAGQTASVQGQLSSWQQSAFGGFTLLASLESIDLTGYSLQDKTVYFQGVINQEVGVVQGFNAGGGVCQILNLVTTTPVSMSDLVGLQSDGFLWNLPGSSQSSFNLDNVVQGRIRQYEQLTTTGFITQTAQSTWGSGDSTAASRLFLTTALIYPTNVDGNISIPDQAYVIPIMIGKEDELEYMMRLTRSIEPVY
jgi:hypothetical protein